MTIDRKIQKTYEHLKNADRQLRAISAAAREGTATLRDAGIYASRVGNYSGESLLQSLTELIESGDEEIIRIVQDVIYHAYTDSSEITEAAFEVINRKAGVNLKPIIAELDTERAAGIADMIIEAENSEEIRESLKMMTENLIRSGVDSSIKKNAEFQSESGMETVVIRTYDDVGLHGKGEECPWCRDREGTWSYQDAIDHGVFERHPGCGCTIEYQSKKTGTHTRNSGGGSWTRLD